MLYVRDINNYLGYNESQITAKGIFDFNIDITKDNSFKIILTNFANLPSVKDYENEMIIDITSSLQSMKGAEHIIYLLEQLFSTMSDKTKIIVDVDKLDDVKKYLKLTFSEYLDIIKFSILFVFSI